VAFLEKLGVRSYSSRDLMLFCRQLATMLQTGIPLLHALKVLAGQIENIAFGTRIEQVQRAIEEGSSFAEALAKQVNFFPPLLIGMVETGETAGVLDTIMDRMAEHYEKQHDLEEKLRSATAYPLFISAVALVVIMVMIVFVLPQFANIFNSFGMEMPLFSRVLLQIGKLAAAYWPLLLLLPLLFYFALKQFPRTDRSRLLVERLKLNLPIFGRIYRQTAAARFSRSLSTLLASGITLHQSLILVDRVVNNLVFSQAIAELGEVLTRGDSLSGSLKEARSFPPLLVEMIRVGEESGTLDYTLNKTALFYEREVTYLVDRLGSLLEPILLLIVGLLIGLIVYSVMSPMYQVFQMI
jgi:type IV pilus assembly protein PilC